MQSVSDLKDLVELNLGNPKVASFLDIIIRKTAEAEANFRANFLNKLLEDLKFDLTSEAHLTTGDIDYLFEVKDYIVGFEAKPPSIIEKQGDYTYRDELKKHFEQVQKYFGDPKLNYLILTDGINWYFYSRKSIRKTPPHFIDFRTTQFLNPKSAYKIENLEKNIIIDSLRRWEEESDLEGLDEKFYRSLKSWVDICKDYLVSEGIPEEQAKSEAVVLINKFIFIRSLEDFGTLPFNYLRNEVKDYLDRWGHKEGAERLSRDINDWMFKHYDTELFAKYGANLSSKIWEFLVFSKLPPNPKTLFTPTLYDFNFSNIDFDILGHVYERFLAELKKEKGIYYTQRFAVDYIVNNTINDSVKTILSKAKAKLEENDLNESKSIIENELFGLKILDPAMGSGSFLISALDLLMDAYQKWEIDFIRKYNELHKDDEFPITRSLPNGYRAIDNWKEKLLLNCLHGIDIDEKAVDVAKLNLWLRLIRNDPEDYYWKKLQDSEIYHALPNLSLNLVNGNSLIGPGLESTLEKLKKYEKEIAQIEKLRFGYIQEFKERLENIYEIEKLKEKIKREFVDELKELFIKDGLDINNTNLATIWFLEFPFRKFDAVIGNPPYIGEEDHKEIFRPVKTSPLLSDYYEGKMDYWYFFCQLGILLLKDEGYISFIVPHYWPKAEGAAKLIKRIVDETSIESIFDFNEYKVFKTTAPGQHNMVFNFRKSDKKIHPKIAVVKNIELSIEEMTSALRGEKIDGVISYEADRQDRLINGNGKLHFTPRNIDAICNSIKKEADGVLGGKGGFCNVNQGIVPAVDIVGIKSLKRLLKARGISEPSEDDIIDIEKELGIKRKDGVFVLSLAAIRNLKLNKNERELIKPFFWGHQIRPFYADPKTLFSVIYTSSDRAKEIRKYPQKYPNIKAHLDKYKAIITSDFAPYGLHRARDSKIFIGEKIMGLRQTKYPTFAFSKIPYYVGMVCNIITAKKKQDHINLRALTAILNSRLSLFWFYHRGKRKGEQLQIDGKPLENFPLKLPKQNISEKLESLVKNIENLKGTYYNLLDKWNEGVKLICGESKISLDYLLKSSDFIEISKCKTHIENDREIGDIDLQINKTELIVSTNVGDNNYYFRDRVTALHVLYSLEHQIELRGKKVGNLHALLTLEVPYKYPGLFKENSFRDFFKELEDFAKGRKLYIELGLIKKEVINTEQDINKIVADIYRVNEIDLLI